jgi:hypothetical protein
MMDLIMYPKLLYHPIHGEVAVNDKEDEDKLLQKGWLLTPTDQSRKGQLIAQIKALHYELDACEQELKEIVEDERKSKKAVEPPKFDEDGRLVIGAGKKGTCIVKGCGVKAEKDGFCMKHYDEQLESNASSFASDLDLASI